MDGIRVERRGGLAGFGSARLRSQGTLDPAALSDADRDSLRQLFATAGTKASATHPDGFVYRITWAAAPGPETIEVPEDRVPEALRACVVDRLD